MSRTTVEEIKARIPIEELIGSYVKLDKAGKSYKARCPFHNEKTGSFFVSPDRGGYYCFGCGEKGDIFSFVEKFEGLDFRGALKVLAEKAGVPLIVDQKADSDKDRLFKITEEAARYFEEQLDKSKEAQDYLKGRGINPETKSNFRIGFAPDGWKNLYTYLKSKGWNDIVIEKAGFVKKPEGRSDFYDRFRGRIIFPITDSSGRVVAFTGRILKDDGKSAKYLNSPETPLFNKSQILFGLDKAKSEIRRLNYSILVEGQMDLILSHQSGVKNTIAASGTALTDQDQSESGIVSNLGMVRRLSENMIIALDSDKAGRTATMRAVAATALSMGMSVKIADIEGGKDPADLILKDPESWRNVLKNAKHVVEFELGNVLRDIRDKHKLSQAIRERVFPYLGRIDSEMDKAYYIKIIAEKISLSEHAVWDDFRKVLSTLKNVQNKSVSNIKVNSGISHDKENVKETISKLANTNDIQKIGLIERRMFGLLFLMESAKLPIAVNFREQIKNIIGDRYQDRIKRVESISNDISFEAEAFFGHEQNRWEIHMKELIMNFEEDLIGEELITTMGELRLAEKANDTAKVAEMAKKCQVLSIKKAEVSKRRRG